MDEVLAYTETHSRTGLLHTPLTGDEKDTLYRPVVGHSNRRLVRRRARERLEHTAFPFFERTKDRESILRQCVDNNYEGLDFETRPRIVCAIILFERGDRSAARSILMDHLRNAADHRGHVEYVKELMERMGMTS